MFPLVSFPGPINPSVDCLSVSHVGKEGLVTFDTLLCLNGMCKYNILSANKQRHLKVWCCSCLFQEWRIFDSLAQTENQVGLVKETAHTNFSH